MVGRLLGLITLLALPVRAGVVRPGDGGPTLPSSTCVGNQPCVLDTQSVLTSSGTLVIQSTTTTSTHPIIKLESMAGSELLRFQQNGRLGIGITNPASLLDLGLNGTLTNTWDSSAVTGSQIDLDSSKNFTKANSTGGTNANSILIDISGDYLWGLHANATGVGNYAIVAGVHGSSSVGVAMVVDDGPNISTGILIYQAGMTTANAEQDIIRINAATRWQDDLPKGLFAGDFLDFRSSGAATSSLFRVGSQGDLAIGTTFYVKSSQVGIGTTAPAYTADITGSLRTTGQAIHAGSVTVNGQMTVFSTVEAFEVTPLGLVLHGGEYNKATILGATPDRINACATCSNCTKDVVCCSTGTAAGQWCSGSDRAAACN